MAIDEHARHQLFTKLVRVLGEQEALTLMEHLPPVGWADVATKTDLAHLREATELIVEASEHRMRALIFQEVGSLRGAMARQTWTMTLAMIGTTLTVASLGLLR